VTGSCINCPAGTYLNYEGGSDISNCTNCSAGKSSTNGSITCIDCPVGKHAIYEGTATPCSDCHRGKYAAVTSMSSSCTHAQPGSYVSIYGASSSTPCAAGTYTAQNASWNCTLCDLGTFNDVEGSTQCFYCPNGTSSNQNRTSCDICEAGKYSHFKSTLSLCISCPVDYYQPSTHSANCLKCSDQDESGITFSTDGATGATECVEATTSSSCRYGFDAGCQQWFQVGAASMSFIIIILVCLGIIGRSFFMAKSSFTAKFEEYYDDDEVMYGTRRAGRYEVTCKKLDVYEGPHPSERRVHSKNHGDVLNVIASKDDWLLLDDGEGWVLGFDKNRGARVSLIDDNDYSLEGRMSEAASRRKSKGNFRSSIYGGRMSISSKKRQSKVNYDENEDEEQGSAKVTHRKSRRSSIAAVAAGGKKLARRASSIIAHPVQAISSLYEASVQNSVIGGANSRAMPAYYEVEVDEDEEASKEWEKQIEERKKQEAFAFMEQEEEGIVSSMVKALPTLPTIFVRPGDQSKAPPPPSDTNPYDLIETKKYLGSEGGVEEALPPPRPTGLPPSTVPRELFEDAHKSTYEVQYYKVHIRSSPSLKASIIGTLSQKDIVYVEEENRHWVKVKEGPPNDIAGGLKGHPSGWVLRFQKKYGPLLRLIDAEIWDTYHEVNTGRPYYVNRATSECTWRHPTKRPAARKPPSTPPPLDAVSAVAVSSGDALGAAGDGGAGDDATGSQNNIKMTQTKRQSML
jgi:hypothetical protein